MYTQTEFTILSEVDDLPLSVMEVTPDETPKAVFQIVHGMCEHKERYLPFMQFLAGEGYASVALDLRGHGKSVLEPEDLGYTYGGGAEAILQDVDTVNAYIHDTFPGIPLILFGHSMGSLIVRAYTGKHGDRMDMLIISGSPSDTPARKLGKWIAGSEAARKGDRHRSTLLDMMSFGSYAGKFAAEKSRFAWLSTDPEVYKAYEESELCGFTFTDDAFIALFDLMEKAYDVSGWTVSDPAMPVLFLSGHEDPCMGSVRKFASALNSMRLAGYTDVKGKIYRGMRHEILNEVDKQQVFSDIVKYVRKKGF